MMKSVFIAVVLISGILANYSLADANKPPTSNVTSFGSCSTPNHRDGQCIYLEDCQHLYKLLLTNPLPDTDKSYLRSSQCGYRDGRVLICCPLAPSQSSTAPPTENSVLPPPGKCGLFLAGKIIGGNLTKIDEFPWMALIQYTNVNGSKSFNCGGSLINSRYVITASHCVKGLGLDDLKVTGVRLGEWDIRTNPDCEVDIRGNKDCAPEHVDVGVDRTIPHPQYNPSSPNQANDIALLRLERAISYTDFIRPICLPLSPNLRSATFEGTAMDVAGWGQTEARTNSPIKLKAAVDGISLDKCRSLYKHQSIELQDSQMCAGGENGINACFGDSGGPLMALSTTNPYYFLAGIVSFGVNPCGLGGWPSVYTKVGDYIDWIEQTIKSNN